jgi:8-hydroxy-5-deazaflavin:NADPH oxidoreductase
MTISIVGSGNIGSALARHFARKSLAVSIANTRGISALASLAAQFGTSVKAVDLDEALQADIVILALPY